MSTSISYQPPPWLDFRPNMDTSPWTLFAVISGLWIVYRMVKVFQKPAAEIDELLGHDIPPQPEVALSNVSSNSVTLYWKCPDSYHTPITNSIVVNGVAVLEPDSGDTAVKIPHLVPGHHYTIRAISTNSSGYSSYSRLIQVQTTPSDGHRTSKLLSLSEPGTGKRPSTGGRRVSAPVIDNEREKERPKGAELTVLEEPDDDDSLIRLNQKLDSLRIQQVELQLQLDQESQEAETSRTALLEERDQLKKWFDDKDKAYNDSRKHLLELEKGSKAAQRKKSTKERDLQKKKEERLRMKDDIARWASERQSLQQTTEKLQRDLTVEEERQAGREAEARSVIDEALARTRVIEDEIKDWGIKIKVLSKERELEEEAKEEKEAEADRLKKDEEGKYATVIQQLEEKFVELTRLIAAIDPELAKARERARNETQGRAQGPGNDYGYGYALPRSARGSISQGMSSMPFVPSTYAPAPATGFGRNNTMSPISGLSELFRDSIPDDERADMSAAELGHLTGGAPMSPAADALLPSNLLRDEGESTIRPPREGPAHVSDLFADLVQIPQSPASQHSGARNFLPSPSEDHASLNSTSNQARTDISHAMDNLNHAAQRRGIFSSWTGRKAPQHADNEQTLLPTLKQGESQSFANDEEDETRGSRGHQRNESTLTNPFADMIPGRKSVDDLQISPAPAPRKPRFFGRKSTTDKEPFYGLDRESSPRPTSTYSHDAQLQSRDTMSAFANISGPDLFRVRNSPLGHDWSSLHEPSVYPSRRQSVQYGSTGNLSLGSSALNKDGRQPPAVAPIGSGRPGKSKVKKLNPNAQSFVFNMFSRSESKKTPTSAKNAPSESGSNRPSIDLDSRYSVDDSPARDSRDDYSMMTSTTDSHDSIGGESFAGSDVAGSVPSTSTPKENLIARLTRKSSSTKFNTPWSKDRKDKERHTPNLSLSSRRKSTEVPSTPSEFGEEASDYLGQSASSAYGSNVGTPLDGKFDDKLDEPKDKGKDKSKGAARGSLSSSWSKMMGGKKKKETSTAMSETSESRDEDDLASSRVP